MRIWMRLLFLLLVPANSHAAGVIGPVEFERIWLLNNQRNLMARYHQRTEIFRRDQQPLWYLDIDYAPRQIIRTSAGDMEAILDRLGFYYQDADYLFLFDWLSLIPQPQTTEGFTYGDTIAARNWQVGEDYRLTLGVRLQNSPKSIQLGGQTVFNLTDNASSDTLGGFLHLNYGDWDFGSYYSRRDGNQANSLNLSIIDSESRSVSTTLSYLGGAVERGIAARYELSLNHRELISQHELRSGITFAALRRENKSAVSNAYLLYSSPKAYGFRFSGGLFHTRLIEADETLNGAKLGVEYSFGGEEPVNVGYFIRKNAFGDIDAMVVKDEIVHSFTFFSRSLP